MKYGRKYIRRRRIGLGLSLLLVLSLLCSCQGAGEDSTPVSDSAGQTESFDSHTEAEPVTLEQELLKRRGKPYDQSDYPKINGGEGIIDITSEFDCEIDHGYSTTMDAFVVSGGKIYRANFNSLLSNGKNLLEVGTLPSSSEVQYWNLTYDGEMGNVYFKDGTAYKLSAQTPVLSYTMEKMDTVEYPLFKKVYRYAADGKTLEDHTEEYVKADKVYDFGSLIIAWTGDKVSLIFPGQYLKESTTWNWYWDLGWREYIAFDLDVSVLGGETPIRLFNKNILMTNCAFYEIIYASKPLDDKDAEAQLAPDGSVSPYYPAAEHKNCNLTLRKLTLLSNYYSDVRNICTSHVITDDYTLLPISEIITEGYSEYFKYDCDRFYWDYSQE